MSWKDDYPYLFELYSASDVKHPDNYFARLGCSPQAIQSYRDWEDRFARLDSESRHNVDENLATFGVVQMAHDGLPVGLKRKLKSVYATACDQLNSVTTREPTQRICAFFISIDRQFAFDSSNLQALIDFMASIQGDCKIYHDSQYW